MPTEKERRHVSAHQVCNGRLGSVDLSDTVRVELGHQPMQCVPLGGGFSTMHRLHRVKNQDTDTYSQSMTPSSRDFLNEEPNVLAVTACGHKQELNVNSG